LTGEKVRHCFFDIGSNSVRGLVVEVNDGKPAVLDDVSRITRLALGKLEGCTAVVEGQKRRIRWQRL
jgi:exopolyphosphatase/pppGpp-phosphohydrolase